MAADEVPADGPELTARILATVDRLGYSPNALTRSIFQGRSDSIGVLIGDLRSPFYPGLIRGVEEVATPAGHLPVFANTSRDPDVERRLLRMMEEQRVRGAVITTGSDTDDITRQMAASGTQCVLITRKLAPSRPGVHSIRLDDRAAGELAYRHLRENGHTEETTRNTTGNGAGLNGHRGAARYAAPSTGRWLRSSPVRAGG